MTITACTLTMLTLTSIVALFTAIYFVANSDTKTKLFSLSTAAIFALLSLNVFLVHLTNVGQLQVTSDTTITVTPCTTSVACR